MSEQTSLIADETDAERGAPAFATFATADGRLLRLNPREHPGGGIEMMVSGRGAPIPLDRYQMLALMAALREMVDAP